MDNGADSPNTVAAPATAVPDVVCTLTTKEMVNRGLEFADLHAIAISSERIERGSEHGVASIYPIEHADAIEDLASRESSCCGSWLNLTTTRTGDVIRMEFTTANPDGLSVIFAMAGISE